MKKITASIFTVLVFLLLVGTVSFFPKEELLTCINGYGGGVKGILLTLRDTTTIEELLNNHVILHDRWMDLYGGTLRVTGCKAIPDGDEKTSVYRLNDGSLSFVIRKRPPFSKTELQAIDALADNASRHNMQKLFVVIPQKPCSKQNSFASRGVVDAAEEIDQYRKSVFQDAGFSTLDLHTQMHTQNKNHGEMYFKTDHHWKATAGLWAADEIAKACGLDSALLHSDNYTIETHEKVLLGTQGKRVGLLYCQPDDIDIPIPKFETNYTLDIPDSNTHKTGSFEDTLLFRESLIRDYFNAFPYNVFLNGDHGILTIENHNNPNGQDILMIKDSFSDCVAPYLAATCHTLTLIDSRIYEDSIFEQMESGRYDTLLITQSAKLTNSELSYS